LKGKPNNTCCGKVPAEYKMTGPIKSLLVLSLSLILFSCRTFPKYQPNLPHENLLTLVADCRYYLKEDIYRFGYPQDSSGQNAFKSYAIRLANYEKLYPDRYPEILGFMRARLWEKLGDYKQAVLFYGNCADMKGELAEEAEKRRDTAMKFDRICSREIRGTDVESYIRESEAKLAELSLLTGECSGMDTLDLALFEKEKTEVDLALFIQNNRHLISDGINRAIQKWKDIIEENKESNRIQSHRIRLGDLFFTLAKEYASWKPPERIGFEWDAFEGFILEAQRYYYQVSLEDGYPEKREARPKLEALLSYMEDVRKRSR
jgi:hypothetical protein